MSKKYVPSGYQIISIDVSDKTSGTPFSPETEDEKLLYEILLSDEIKKPILLDIKSSGYHLVGFANIDIRSTQVCITYGAVGSSISETITANSNKLTWVENQE